MNILEKLDEYGLVKYVVARLESQFGEEQVKELVRGLSKTKYETKRFKRRLGDSSRTYYHGPKWNRKVALEGYDYMIRMDWRLEEVSREEFVDTLLHELAHNIDSQIRGTSGHDRPWKCLARLLGCRPYAKKDIGDLLVKLELHRRQTSTRGPRRLGTAANRTR